MGRQPHLTTQRHVCSIVYVAEVRTSITRAAETITVNMIHDLEVLDSKSQLEQIPTYNLRLLNLKLLHIRWSEHKPTSKPMSASQSELGKSGARLKIVLPFFSCSSQPSDCICRKLRRLCQDRVHEIRHFQCRIGCHTARMDGKSDQALEYCSQ